LANLPAFTQSERALLKQYFTKNHNFRHKLVSIKERCLIDDNYGVVSNLGSFSEHFGGNAYRNMAPLISDTVTKSLDFLSTLKNNDYLWSFGMGAGTYKSCAGIAHTDSLAQSTRVVRTVFGGFTGSYFCDWDNSNNMLRAFLASKGNMLNSFNVGRPHWYFHHMGLGETIGYSTLRTQNNIDTQAYQYLYPTTAYFNFSIHIALMGDPTVRMQPVEPPHNISSRQDSCNQKFKIRWTASSDTAVHTYYIFRAKHIDSSFTLLGTTKLLYYVDNLPLTGNNVYMVRGEKLQFSGSGTYFNLSQGIFDTISTTEFSTPIANAGRDTSICRLQNLTLGINSINNSKTKFNWNPGGYTTNTVAIQALSSGNRILMATDTFTGCIKRDTMVLTVNPLPASESLTGITTQCSDSVFWNSSSNNGSGFDYSWNFQGAGSYNTSGNALDSPGIVVYAGIGSYLTSLTVKNSSTLCTHLDSQRVNVSCVSLPVELMIMNCLHTANGKQVSFISYENDLYLGYRIEGLIGNKWVLIKEINAHSQLNYNLIIDDEQNYSEIRISGRRKNGETNVMDYCVWQNQTNELNIYPNPVQGQLQINFTGISGNKLCSASIYNSIGLEILQTEFSLVQNTYTINTNDLQAGVYLIMVNIGEKSWSFKFVKE